MMVGTDLRDQFDTLLDASIEDGYYDKFVEYMLSRLSHHEQARIVQAVECANGFWKVRCYDSFGSAWDVPKAMFTITAFPDNTGELNLCQIEIPNDNKL